METISIKVSTTNNKEETCQIFCDRECFLSDFRKAYVYSCLIQTPNNYGSYKSFQTLTHICNYLNTCVGKTLYVWGNNKKTKNVTLDFKRAYNKMLNLYGSTEYDASFIKHAQYDAKKIAEFERDINEKYDCNSGAEFKSQVLLNDETYEYLECIKARVAEFYYGLLRNGLFSLNEPFVYLDFLPKCFNKISKYSLLNLAYAGKNFEFAAFLIDKGYFYYSLLEEKYEIPLPKQEKKRGEFACIPLGYLDVHDFPELFVFLLRSSSDTIAAYKKLRNHNFVQYENAIKYEKDYHGCDVLKGNGREIVRHEYLASVRANDLENIMYLNERFGNKLIDLLLHEETVLPNRTPRVEDAVFPENLPPTTINYIKNNILGPILRKRYANERLERERFGLFNILTGGMVYPRGGSFHPEDFLPYREDDPYPEDD